MHPIRMAGLLRPSPSREVQAWADACDVTPTWAQLLPIERMVRRLKRAEVWADNDALILMAVHDEQAACVDLRFPEREGTPHGGPVFTPQRGFAFDGVATYVDSGFVPATHCVSATGTQGALGVYERADVAVGGVTAAGAGTLSTTVLAINPRTSGDLCAGQYNHAATGNQVASSDSRGLWVVQRDGADIEYFHRGQSQGVKTPSATGSALVGISIYLGARNGNTGPVQFRESRQSLFFMSGKRTAARQSAFYATVQAYLTEVGAAV